MGGAVMLIEFRQLRELLTLICAGAGSVLSSTAVAATYTVNSTIDAPDAFWPDGICDISGTPGPPPSPYIGRCSLRAAIEQANANPGRDTISLAVNVPVTAILPAITDVVFIEPSGTSRASISWVGSGNSSDALFFTTGANGVRRLSIFGFTSGAAIRFTGSGGNSVTGSELTNNREGLVISDTSGNEIGNVAPGRGNVISGNNTGIYIVGANATGNQIVGNFIGVDGSGLAAQPNAIAGIYIDEGGGNFIGTDAGGNIISGNTGPGIYVLNANGTKILSNRIGTDETGTTRIANGGTGIFLRNASMAEIGRPNFATGTTTSSPNSGSTVGRAPTPTAGKFPGNVISGNGLNGILIDGAGSNGNVIAGNLIGLGFDGSPLGNLQHGVRIIGGSDNKIGRPSGGAGNFISSNGRNGVRIEQATATNNLVQANWIGVGLTGTDSRGNATIGVFIDGAKKTVIGGPTDAERNLISASGLAGPFPANYTPPPTAPYAGVHIRGASATENRVQGNIIGMDRDGLIALGNSGSGVIIEDSSDNQIGGLNDPGSGTFPRNLISGNEGSGVVIRGTSKRNLVAGNYIGTDAAGTGSAGAAVPLARTQDVGVWIDRAPGNFVGSDNTKSRNVISNSVAHGVLVTGLTAVGNVVRSNYIGIDESGLVAVPNGESGIALVDASSTLIGGGTASAGVAPGNVISGNLAALNVGAVHIQGPNATRNEVRGNLIGVAADGTTKMPNGYDGVLITDGASDNVIGGDLARYGNVIAYNERTGVAVTTGQSLVDSTRNAVLSNRIYGNKTLGIDLGLDEESPNPKRRSAGVVPPLGPGANDKRASPTLFLVPSAGGAPPSGIATVEGPPNSVLIVQFFGSKSGHVSGYGQGERLIGTTTVTTNTNGFASFPAVLPNSGEVLSATATDAQGNTSEFSKLPCAIPPADVRAIDSALVDPELSVVVRWIEPPNTPASSASSLANRAVIPLAAGLDGAIDLEVEVAQLNPQSDDDLSKAFVVVTVGNLANTPGAPAMRIFRERRRFDANGKATLTLSVEEMLRELGAAENRNFLEARAHVCYRGRVQSAITDKVLHVLREKLVLFLPGVLGSKIEMKFPPVVGPVTQVFPTLLPTSPFLAMNADGSPLYEAEKLSLFDRFLSTDIYQVESAMQEARRRNNLPEVTIGGRQVEYFHLRSWPYDWRLRPSEHVEALLNGAGGAANPALEPRSVRSLVEEFRAGNRYADEKAALAGHSTGGLIVRSAITGTSGAALETHVDRGYFLNTPFLGAPKAYSAFLTGYMDLQVGLLIFPLTFRQLAPNMPVVYHLSPAPGYYDERIALEPDKGDVVMRYPKNGVTIDGTRHPPTAPAHLFMDDVDTLVNQVSAWNHALAAEADVFHNSLRGRRPAIGWRNTLVFASARRVADTPGRVVVDGQGNVTMHLTRGDQTVPLDSQIGDAPDYVVVRNISPIAPDHVPAASDPNVWDEMVDHMGARDEKDFSGTAPEDTVAIAPAANTCAGPDREAAIRASEAFGEGEMNARAAALNYATILTAAQRPFRQGFDAVYCDGEVVTQLRFLGEECQGTLIIGEGKGGYVGRDLENVLASGYGFRQGTLEWAANAARATIAGSSNALQVDVSRGYHASLEAGAEARIEVFHSECLSTYPNKKPSPAPAQLSYKRYISDRTP